MGCGQLCTRLIWINELILQINTNFFSTLSTLARTWEIFPMKSHIIIILQRKQLSLMFCIICNINSQINLFKLNQLNQIWGCYTYLKEWFPYERKISFVWNSLSPCQNLLHSQIWPLTRTLDVLSVLMILFPKNNLCWVISCISLTGLSL